MGPDPFCATYAAANLFAAVGDLAAAKAMASLAPELCRLEKLSQSGTKQEMVERLRKSAFKTIL